MDPTVCKILSMPLLLFAPPSRCPRTITLRGKGARRCRGAFPKVTVQVGRLICPLDGTSSAIHVLCGLRYLSLLIVTRGPSSNETLVI